MSYPLSYGPQVQRPAYTVETKKNSSTPAFISGVAIGGIGGAIAGSKVSPFVSKSGAVKEGLVDSVITKYLKTAEIGLKNSYEQSVNVLKSSIKSLEEFNILKSENAKFFKELKLSTENINEQNLSETVNAARNQARATIEQIKLNIKNDIQTCWNGEKKVFEKKGAIKDDLFSALEKTTKGARFKTMAKFAGIGAAITGVTAFVLHKVLSNKFSLSKQ
jgi:hypothetical protein